MILMWIQACEGQTVCLRRRVHESDGQFSQSGPAWLPGIFKETCSAQPQQRLGADGCFSSWLRLPVTVMVQEAAGPNCSFTGVSNMKLVSAMMRDSSHIDLHRVFNQDRSLGLRTSLKQQVKIPTAVDDGTT